MDRDPEGQGPAANKELIMKWVMAFSGASAGTVLVGIFMLWAATGFAALHVSGAVLAALIGGSLVAGALGIGLMALIFYSDHGNFDEAAGHYVLRKNREG
jgi:hypothetical protein